MCPPPGRVLSPDRTLYRFQECFPSQEGVWEMDVKYPLQATDLWKPAMPAECDHEEQPCSHIGELPDVVLLKVFRYAHPVERVQVLARVSRRWHRLAHHAPLWTDVRIALRNRNRLAARRFLKAIAKNLRQLCISTVCSFAPFVDEVDVNILKVLPSALPRLTKLEVHVRGMKAVEVQGICRCAFNVQFLGISAEDDWEDECFECLTGRTSLPHLRELQLRLPVGVSRERLEALCAWPRHLHALHLDAPQCERAFSPWELKCLSGSCFRESLQALSFGADIFGKLTPEIRDFKNLRRLSLKVSARQILPLKKLGTLEHLHLGLADEWLDSLNESIDTPLLAAFRSLFTLSSQSSAEFPSRLRYLSVQGNAPCGDRAVDIITASCVHLKSLNVCGMHVRRVLGPFHSARRVTLAGLRAIAERLKELEFLDISALDEIGPACLCELLTNAPALRIVVLTCASEEEMKIVESALNGSAKVVIAVRGAMGSRAKGIGRVANGRIVDACALADMLDREGVCCMNVFGGTCELSRSCIKMN